MKVLWFSVLLGACINSSSKKGSDYLGTQDDSTSNMIDEDCSDRDEDGACDETEEAMGTDPDNPDTDGDGILDGDEDADQDGVPDHLEVELGLDPNNSDTDGDGRLDGFEDLDEDKLTNVEEVILGTKLHNEDSDTDGITDYNEVWVFGTNPNQPNNDMDGDGFPDVFEQKAEICSDHEVVQDLDQDGDGLPNVAEGCLGTDYTKADTDGDGMWDGQELLLGLDPLSGEDAVDTDGDGIPDVIEEEMGTNPNEPDTDNDGMTDGLEYLEDYAENAGWSEGGTDTTDTTTETSTETGGFGLADCGATDYESPVILSTESGEGGDTGLEETAIECFVGTIDCNFGERILLTTNGSSLFTTDFYNLHQVSQEEDYTYAGKELVYQVDNQGMRMDITLTSVCQDMDLFAFFQEGSDECPQDLATYSDFDWMESSRKDGIGLEADYVDSKSFYDTNPAPHTLIIESKSETIVEPFLLSVTCQ